MELLRSKLIQAPHAFSTRTGGVSKGAWASLNLSHAVGDAPGDVTENVRRFAAAVGVVAGQIRTVNQVHGDAVFQAREDSACDPVHAGVADALWTQSDGVAIAVRTADCVPLLIEDVANRRVAAVHSGWKGTAAKVAARTVEVLAAQGSKPADLRCALGPCIRRCCYEVDGPLAVRFASGFGADVVEPQGGRPHLDLVLAVKRTLQVAGVRPENIDDLGLCTACDSARFFSHRRDAGLTGRHWALITPFS